MNEHLCNQFAAVPSDLILTPQPNKTKPPLQVLAVAEGNSEKNKVWDETHDGVIINHIKHKTLQYRTGPCNTTGPCNKPFVLTQNITDLLHIFRQA